MTRFRLPALALALVALLVACGVTGGDDAPSDASGGDGSAEAETLSPVDQEMLDVLVETYTSLGFTEEEAECLGRGLISSGVVDESEMPDNSALMDLINGCDISIGRMNEIAGDMGAGTFDEGARIGLAASLEAQGLSEVQAECVADALIDEVGGSSPEDFDLAPDALAPFLEECDVGPEDFGD